VLPGKHPRYWNLAWQHVLLFCRVDQLRRVHSPEQKAACCIAMQMHVHTTSSRCMPTFACATSSCKCKRSNWNSSTWTSGVIQFVSLHNLIGFPSSQQEKYMRFLLNCCEGIYPTRVCHDTSIPRYSSAYC